MKNKWKNKKIGTKKIPIKIIILLLIITGSIITIKDITKKLYEEKTNYYISNANYQSLKLSYSSIKSEQAIIKQIKGTIREITAYNAGDINQCSGDPCISASGDNICKLLEQGMKICACNFVPLRTEIEIENYGRCVVLDRMAKRYSERVDIAMKKNELQKAKDFGLKYLKVKIINK